MTSVSGILASNWQYDISSRRRNAALAQEAQGGIKSRDTVSLSAEALMLATGEAEEQGLTVREQMEQAEEENHGTSADAGAKLERKNFFAMLMESLFLAELEDAGSTRSATVPDAAADATTDGGSGSTADAPTAGVAGGMSAVSRDAARTGKSSFLKDGEITAALKKVITDFMNGKADLAELPKAMAAGASGGTGASASPKTGVTAAASTRNEEGINAA